MRTMVAVPLVSLALAASLAAQRADSSSTHLSVPTSIADFTFLGRHDYDDPALGVMIRYQRADTLQADLFAYPGPDFDAKCSLDCARKAFDGEVQGFIAAFPELVKVGYVDSIAVDNDQTLTPSPNDPWRLGRHLSMHVVRKGAHERSDYFLYYMPHVRVKVRATYESDTARTRAVLVFAAAAPQALLGPPSTESSEPEQHGDSTAVRPIGLTVTLPGSLPMLFQRAVRALVDQGYTIADSSTSAGRIVTAPLLGWPKGAADETRHGKDSPGVVVHVGLTAKGDSTTIEVGSRSPVVAGWKDAKSASSLQMMSVLLMAGALDEHKPKSP